MAIEYRWLLLPVASLVFACGGSTNDVAVKPSSTPPPIVSASAPAPSAIAVVPSASASADEPPSTGKEMPPGQPGPDEDESKKLWADAVALATNAKPGKLDCKKVVSSKHRLAFATAEPDAASVKSAMRAYLRIARCAENLGSYGFLMELGKAMRKADPADGHPELVARAFLGKNKPTQALAELRAAAKKDPDDANVAMTFAKVYCKIGEWKDCKESAEKALALAPKEEDADEQNRILGGASLHAAKALAHLGNFDEAASKLDDAERLKAGKSSVEDIRQEIAMGRSTSTSVDIVAANEMLLGIYHLVGKLADLSPLVRVTIDNLDSADTQYRVEVEIAGITQASTQTVVVGKKASKQIAVTPALKGGFDIDSIRASQPTAISVKVTKIQKGGDTVVIQASPSTTLQPRDYLPKGPFIDEDKEHITKDSRFLAAWVTPNAKAVDAFLAEAKKKLAKGSFSGEQSATVPQVQALFEALRARGVSYVMDPEALTKDVFSQRTRLPSEVLTSTNAQCLEGAILYATLFEAIGLKPSIIQVPGHAFVAWKPSPKDATTVPLYFLETTMTGGTSAFDKVMKKGADEFAEHDGKHRARITEIGALRKAGITPQPAESGK